MKVEVLPATIADLIDIGDDIALESPDRAFSFVMEIEEVIFKKLPYSHPVIRYVPI